MSTRAIPSVFALLIGTMLTALAGCGDDRAARETASAPVASGDAAPGGEPVDEDRTRVGVSLLTLDNPFFVVMKYAIEDACEVRGFDAEVVSGALDVERQSAQMHRFVSEDVDAIVLCAVEAEAIGPAVVRANEAGIPVFTADTAVLAEGAEIQAHVATDNLLGGRMAADAMARALGGRGLVAVVTHDEVESGLLRHRGFAERLRELNGADGVDIQIVAKRPGEGRRDLGHSAAQSFLEKYPDVDGIFAINDPSALGVLTALEQAGREKEISLVGFDGQPDALLAVEHGRIAADIVQEPERIAELVIKAVDDHLAGREVAPVQLIPPTLAEAPGRQQD